MTGRAAQRGGTGPPLVLLHGFLDTWRTWDLVRPALERRHEVLALALLGHLDGPPVRGAPGVEAVVDAAEAAMDAAGVGVAHLAGNSLGGHVALRLAARGRARSVVALAPAGGWATDDHVLRDVLAGQAETHAQVRAAAPAADALVATPAGRRRASALLTERSAHLPAELLAHQIRGAAACDAAPLLRAAAADRWELDPVAIACPVRIVWGLADRLLPWPAAALRLRRDLLPHADWVELDGVGHAPQLDVPLETAQLILGLSDG